MIKDGGLAFPVFSFNNEAHSVDASGGMSLRDYFAARIVAAIVVTIPSMRIDGGAMSIGQSYEDTNLRLAETAYAVADAMLKARES